MDFQVGLAAFTIEWCRPSANLARPPAPKGNMRTPILQTMMRSKHILRGMVGSREREVLEMIRVRWVAASVAALAVCSLSQASFADDLAGAVRLGGQAVSGAKVILWRTAGNAAPSSLAEASTDASGAFEMPGFPEGKAGGVYYLTTRTGPSDAVALLSVLGEKAPPAVVVNELTTVASVFTNARFINGTAISGNDVGLRIAAGNVPNLVDPSTGTWGKVVLNPLNSSQTATLAKLNTLGNLITAFATTADAAWRTEFLKTATADGAAAPTDTLQAMAGIARRPWVNTTALYGLFDAAYPQPKDGARRDAPLLPYLFHAPSDFALSLWFDGGGALAAGKQSIDADGNIWSGVNWMPGSQSGVAANIGGGTAKYAPDGTALSPAITGFTGMGLDGVGWGTGVSEDKVWIGGLNGTILLMGLDGKPIGQESDFPMAGQLGGLMGSGFSENGDVWMADGTRNRLLHFPGGRVADGRIVEVPGLKSPFGVAIDAQNRVWVSNSQSNTVVRFGVDDPSKIERFTVGGSVRGVALGSKGNLWAASNEPPEFPPEKIPDGVPIMVQFEIALKHMLTVLEENPKLKTGVLNMITSDGTQSTSKGYGDGVVSVPWGVSIDGADDVWFGNFWGRGVGLMAGTDPKSHAAGTKTGDVIHIFQSGAIQMITDVGIDPAGNDWAAHNWNDLDAVVAKDPTDPILTKGGGQGVVVLYGVAAPVRTPLLGMVRKP